MRTTVHVYEGIITARTGPAQGDPTTIRYTARAVNTRHKVGVDNVVPKWRYWRAPEIIAADVGTPCRLRVVKGGGFDEVQLYDVQEGIPFENC